MATHQFWIPAAAFAPDSSGKVWLEPYSILATNDLFKFLVMRFDEDGANNAQLTTKVTACATFHIPQNYVGTPKIYVAWSSTVTTGNSVWDVDYRAIGGDDAESMDQGTYQEALTVTDAAPSAAHERNIPSVSLTAGNLAVGDTVELCISADGVDAADTQASARILFGVIFEYADA
jgi:hypothetical protein